MTEETHQLEIEFDIPESSLRRIKRVLAEQRGHHPELRRALTWNGVKAILRRLDIPIVTVPMVRPAALVAQLGARVLLIDSNAPPRRHTYFVAHELAHLWLHIEDARCDEAAPIYYMNPCWQDDEREDEAETLATLMLGGPRFSRHF